MMHNIPGTVVADPYWVQAERGKVSSIVFTAEQSQLTDVASHLDHDIATSRESSDFSLLGLELARFGATIKEKIRGQLSLSKAEVASEDAEDANGSPEPPFVPLHPSWTERDNGIPVFEAE